MKNLQKGSVTIVVMVIIVMVLIAAGYFYFKPRATETVQNPQTTDLKTFENGDFSIVYSNKIFSETAFNGSLPPKYDAKYSGIKLISASRVQMIGKNQCSYGQSGLVSTCTSEKEGGVSFTIVNQSIQNLTSGLEPSLKANATIAGKQSISWKIGAEGEGIDYHFVPINSNKTLVVARLYRDDGFPTNADFDEIISTLRLK